MTGPIRHIGIVMAVAAAFGWGIVIEAWADDLNPLATIIPFLLLLAAALAVSFSARTGWVAAMILGAAAGSLAAVMLGLGAFSLFALEVGGRELNGFGDPDITWQGALFLALVFSGIGGAVVGAICGAAARAMRWGLASWPRPGP